MHRSILALALVVLVGAMSAPVVMAAPQGQDKVTSRGYDEHGRLAWEQGVRTDDDKIGFERIYHYAADKAKGGGRPGGGGGGGGGTDCPSTSYVKAGWHWSAPYSALASQHAAVFDAAGSTWDNQTGSDIFGAISAGSGGQAGTFDGVNQIDFVSLSSTSTIAVTTTWYNRLSGLASESDGQYNTYFTWGTSGAAGVMDVQDIATHEIGHTFGLDHPKGSGGISCLTMYAYGGYGELQKRTLGDGDILGIRAVYGA